MRILVTGAGGQLGNELQIVSKNSIDEWFFTSVSGDYDHLDITDLDSVRDYVKKNRIDTVVNCAAWTDVDGAEKAENQEKVKRINSDGPGILGQVMREAGGWLIHISTDYVFGGQFCNKPCNELMTGCPTGVYGQTKLHGEELIKASGCRNMIIRTSWLYSEFGKNFCKTMLKLTEEKERLKVVFDQVGTPTYAGDLAEAISVMMRNPVEGIFNFSNEGVCSWFDFARMINDLSGHHCEIDPCHRDEFPSKVKRPNYSVLDKTLIKKTFGIKIPYWTDSLKKCISNLTNG